MKKTIVICLILIFCFSLNAFANEQTDIIINNVKSPSVAVTGGEWAVIALARSVEDIPQSFFEDYYKNAVQYIKNCNGVLHDKKYTEYSRVILALNSIGKDAENIAGYNLVKKLDEYDNVVYQGINGAIWALIALDSGNYDTTDIKQKYVEFIIEHQNDDGGFSLTGESVTDITAMALQALSKHLDEAEVKTAVDKALDYLSKTQNNNGGFDDYTLESSAQALIALCELNISITDERFVKNGNNLYDSVMSYYIKNHGFLHMKIDSHFNQMSTEQGMLALDAYERFNNNKSSLYDMSDHITIAETKNEINKIPVVRDVDFNDVKGSKYKNEIKALAERNIINGRENNCFAPDDTMTRAEFATIVVNSLELTEKDINNFIDVNQNDWFYDYVNIAKHYGIIMGVSDTEFEPDGTITKEEACVMISRAALLCNIKNTITYDYSRDVLAGFEDYTDASDWARIAIAFCCDSSIIDDSQMQLEPQKNVEREEIAYMLYNMLVKAELI